MAFGLTPNGFVVKQQQTIIAEIQASLQSAFGQNINLLPESIFGQLVGIFSEREALIWQLAEAVYDSQYPSGAEGTSVDNILALNNLTRLAATATITDPNPLTGTDDITLYGLVLRGTPGTVIPLGSIINTNLSPASSFTLDATVTIASAVDAVQSLFFSSVPDSGTFTLKVGGDTSPTSAISYLALANQTKLTWAVAPTSGHFKITLDGSLSTAFIQWNDTAPTIQSAIQALSGYSGVTVSGSIAGGLTITWGAIENPLTTITASTLDHAGTVIDSVQAIINSIVTWDDVTVSGNYTTGFVITFTGSVGATPIAITVVNSDGLLTGITVVNINVVNTAAGAPAQAVGSATCTATGPTPAPAGSLAVIGTPISGWTSVTNQLDTLAGTNIENDTEALQRRSQNLQNQANGPLQSIVDKVKAVKNVTDVAGFENLNISALQLVTFSAVPDAGNFKLILNSLTTGNIAYTATAADVQTAIRALSGFSAVIVTGSYLYGFLIDFEASGGPITQPLIVVTGNTLTLSSNPVTTVVAYNRPGKSFEIVVQGGADSDIANAIYGAKPAGIQSYGSTTVNVEDEFGNAHPISFQRPTEIPIYVTIALTTDLTTAAFPQFNPGSINTIQSDIVDIVNAVGIGGLIIAFGSGGLVGAFNAVPGIVDYTLNFGIAPSPSGDENIQLLSTQIPVAETFNVIVSYT
jgi:uncharacterized phage protein gp47/JayE